MIKGLTSQGPYLVVTGGFPNYPYVSPGSVCAGQLRWNTNTNEIEINDGVIWRSLGANNTSIGLSTDAQEALTWAVIKMKAERELNQRMERHPGLRDTYEKFQIMDALCREEDARQLNS
jgi:hypothetical protein